MNIINKTLLPISNLPEGEAILNINIYDIDNSAYLGGTELTNAYTVTPNKSRYNIGETVTIVLNSKYGTLAERTFTRVITDPITNLEFNISTGYYSVDFISGVTGYVFAIAPTANSTHNSNRLTNLNFYLYSPTYESTSKSYGVSTNDSIKNISISSRGYYSAYYENETRLLGTKIVGWGGFSPNKRALQRYWGVSSTVTNWSNFFPSRIPSGWKNLVGLFTDFPAVKDLPETWDVSNIDNISSFFGSEREITTFPNRLFSKPYKEMANLFTNIKLGENVDLSLVDYSEVTALESFVGTYYYSEYYDKMLKKWAETTPTNRYMSVSVNAPYTPEGEQYRNILVQRGWTIYDLGLIQQHTKYTYSGVVKDSNTGEVIENAVINFRELPTKFKIGSYIRYTVTAPNYQPVSRNIEITSYGTVALDQDIFMSPVPKTLTVTVNPSSTPTSQYIITKTPNKATYVNGEVITVTLTSSIFENMTEVVTMGLQDINLVFDLEAKRKVLTLTPKNTANETIVIPAGAIKYFVNGVEELSNRFVPGTEVRYTINIPGYLPFENTIVMDADKTQSDILTKTDLTLTLTTVEGGNITIDNVKETYTEGDVVNARFYKDGAYDVVKTYIFQIYDIVDHVEPVTEDKVMKIEYVPINEINILYGLEIEGSAFIKHIIKSGTFIKEHFSIETSFVGLTESEIISGGGVLPNGDYVIEVYRLENFVRQPNTVYIIPDMLTHKISVKRDLGNIVYANRSTRVKLLQYPFEWRKSIVSLFNYVVPTYTIQPALRNMASYNTSSGSTEEFLGNMSNYYLEYGLFVERSAFVDWDFNIYTNLRYMFKGSKLNFKLTEIIDFSNPNFTNIVTYGTLIDPAKYDDMLNILATMNLTKTLGFDNSNYTTVGLSARQQLNNSVGITDGGLVNPLRYNISIKTNIDGVTITKSPEPNGQDGYNVGTLVTLTATKSGYETQTIYHTIERYLESNIITIDMVVKTYYPTITVKDDEGRAVAGATITMTPNKQSYLIGETVVIKAEKENYLSDTKTITIQDGVNNVDLVLVSTLPKNTLVVTPIPSDMYLEIYPLKTNYDIGEQVTIYGEKVGYEAKSIFHTIVEGENRVTIELEEKQGYNISIYSFDMEDNSLSPTITKYPNKELYEIGETVVIKAELSGYATQMEEVYIDGSGDIATIITMPASNKWVFRVDSVSQANYRFRFISSERYFNYELLDGNKTVIGSGQTTSSGSSGTYTNMITCDVNTQYIVLTPTRTGSVGVSGIYNITAVYPSSNTTLTITISILSSPYNSNGFGVYYNYNTGSGATLFGNRTSVNYFAPTARYNSSTASQIGRYVFSYLGDKPNLNFKFVGANRSAVNYGNTFNGTKVYSDLSLWDFSNATSMTYFMSVLGGYGGFATADLYDKLLNSWVTNPERRPSSPLSVSFGESKYTSSGASARDQLVAAGFTITDGGLQS